MKIVEQSAQIEWHTPDPIKTIEKIGRVCYKSEEKITEDSASKFVAMLVKRGHEAMIEHAILSVRFVTDRGVSHELVRHRIASFAQESTRYVNYGNAGECTFIKPCWHGQNNYADETWRFACSFSEKQYFNLLELGLGENFSFQGVRRWQFARNFKTKFGVEFRLDVFLQK